MHITDNKLDKVSWSCEYTGVENISVLMQDTKYEELERYEKDGLLMLFSPHVCK